MTRTGAPVGIFTVDAAEYLDSTDPVEVQRLGDGLWTAACGDHRAVFAEGDASVVALNTFGTPAAARAYRDAIAATVPDKPIGTVVCTIDHLDHTGYGEALAPGADVIAHELCARVIAGRGADGQCPAGRTVTGAGEDLTLDGVTLRLHHLGPSVGTGNVAVQFPARRVVFLVGPRADARYGLLPDIHLRHVTRVWRELAALDVGVVVPGRGPLMDRARLLRAADYVDALDEACQRAFAGGVPIWEIAAMESFAAGALRARFGDLEGFDDHIGIGAIRVVHHYVMGGWGMEDTG
jgi:glyoxylase-like metal-dependent hydrolase (beta-lactamase superfamily II)